MANELQTGEAALGRVIKNDVLGDLARMVGSMADATQRDAGITADLAKGEHTFMQLAESLVTRGSELPMGPIAGAEALAAMGENLDLTAKALADGQKARAEELNAVRKKEEEEKESGGGGGKPGGESGTEKDDDKKKEGDDDTGTANRDETPIEEIDAPNDTTRTGSGASTVSPTPIDTTSGPGSIVNEPGDGSGVNPSPKDDERAPPKIPVPATGDGLITITKKRTRRCFKFRLRNATNKPVSDLHFDGEGLSMTSSSVGRKGGLQNWKPFNVRGGKGLLFKVEDGKPPVPPGGRTAAFEFCTESSPRGFEIRLSHPDDSFTPLGPGSITVGGRPARQHKGKTVLPPESLETVYDLEVEVTEGGQKISIRSSSGLGTDVKTEGDRADSFSSGKNGKDLTISPIPSDQPFRPGEKIKLTVSSKSSGARFRIR